MIVTTDAVQTATVAAILNVFEPTDKGVRDGRLVFYGPNPRAIDHNTKAGSDVVSTYWRSPWIIKHPDAEGKLWRLMGFERFAAMILPIGSPVGLVVEPWDKS